MTKARNIANIASDGSALADGTINYTDVSGTPTLATVATSGAYADVTGTPTLAAVATSGSFNDLSNQPSPFDPNTLATVATTGAYADVTGTPTLATVATTGAYADVTGTPAAALPLAGGTLTGNVNLGDNVKANFGAGSDLQIYHSGTDSWIEDNGSGNLYIDTNGSGINISYNNSAENMASFTANGAVTLYHDNAAKLATSATGISVTGNATFADNGKAIFGAGSDLQIYHNGGDSVINESTAGNLLIQGDNVYLQNSGGTASYFRGVDGGAVDIRYAGNVKLATTATGISVTGGAYLLNTASSLTMTLQGNTGSVAGIRFQAEEVHGDIQGINSGNNFGGLAFSTNYNGTVAEKMRINESGKVGIGEASPESIVHITGPASGGGAIMVQTNGAFGGTDSAAINFRHYDDTGNPTAQIKAIGTTNYTGDMVFSVRVGGTSGAGGAGLTERMRISSTGVISGNGSGLTGVSPPTTYGAVGTYVFASQFVVPNSAGTTESSTVAGSALLPGGLGMNELSLSQDAQKAAEVTKGGSALSGTWRAMGRANHNWYGNGTATGRWNLFVRIS